MLEVTIGHAITLNGTPFYVVQKYNGEICKIICTQWNESEQKNYFVSALWKVGEKLPRGATQWSKKSAEKVAEYIRTQMHLETVVMHESELGLKIN